MNLFLVVVLLHIHQSLNGKIESLIVTFGGSGYFGAPDVIITGDGVGATAFANVDLSQNIVTSITVTNKGVGYTAGNTRIDIVYPGSGASIPNQTYRTYAKQRCNISRTRCCSSTVYKSKNIRCC